MFEVKNTKQEQVKVTLSEQLPLSTDERIKVSEILCRKYATFQEKPLKVYMIRLKYIIYYKINLHALEKISDQPTHL